MPSKSSKEHRAMAAACTGKSTLGIPKKVGCEFMHADKGAHFSPNNNNTPMSVVKCEDTGDGSTTVHLEGENGATATLPMPTEDAAAYPEGAKVVLHCIPEEEEPEAEENMAADETEYPDNLQGRRAKEQDAIIARTKGYREEA